MKPLPATRYELADWKDAKVNIDYHVDYEGRLYSVPHTLIGARGRGARNRDDRGDPPWRRARGRPHRRSYGPKGTSVTLEAHRPKCSSGLRRVAAVAHHLVGGVDRSVGGAAWSSASSPISRTPSRATARAWRSSARPTVRPRADRGRVQARARASERPTRKSVEAILKRGLDRAPARRCADAAPRIVVHENIRGGDYFDKKEDGDDPGRDNQEVA